MGTQETAEDGLRAASSPPVISLPTGGGAIRGIGEKFAANPVTGTGSLTVPIFTSPGRAGFSPDLSLSYDSGSGNGPFGIGWSISLPSITRKTDKGLPKYRDSEESDVFILSDAEDLVPVLSKSGDTWERQVVPPRTVNGVEFHIDRYRPRIEGLFARIERWTNSETSERHWRSISRDNVTTVYGVDNNSRIFDSADPDPQHPTRIFSWLICQSYDDKGNAIVYEYEDEDSSGVDVSQAHERNRTAQSRSTNRYLKRIKYGNRTPNRDTNWNATDPAQLAATDWMFEVVFDYGEGHFDALAPEGGHQFVAARISNPPNRHWPVRQDPFSIYRPGFEVRTYRLCRRVLMFHHFPAELGIPDYLVRSTDFRYSETPIASFITALSQSGYVHKPNGVSQNRYLRKSTPPLEFEYSQATVHEDVQEVDTGSLENLPQGVDGGQYQWVDLDGEGLSGILTEQAGAWFYKRNFSPITMQQENGTAHTKAHFGPVEIVAQTPSLADLGTRQQLLDLAGDGRIDLVQFSRPVSGFHERTIDETWLPFTPFESLPDVALDDPNVRFVDLTGDGHADMLVSEDQVFIWYPSLGEAGFGPSERVAQALDEEDGPRLVFADGTQSIYLADMCGDGLSDLVRIRNGNVCYWPNLGYGCFGARVTMDNAPRFDTHELFDQARIRLADIDGSGTNDIIYLNHDGVHLYFNQEGNSWSISQPLQPFPHVDNLSSVMAVDLLGNGTACLAWSSSLPGDARRPMRYTDLMGGLKPHLLVSVRNNLGAETHIHYAPSTRFYLEDKLAGKPWITRLPFPVHVVERVETYDHISRNRFVTRYAYHHGYFDGEEREFRGFGMVEQFDTEEFAALSASGEFLAGENIDDSSHVPPIRTRTWFHTGAFIDRHRISRQFETEYYREPGLSDDQFLAQLLPDTTLPSGLSADERREACRSLKGMMLRQEVYADDATPGSPEEIIQRSGTPYTVVEHDFTIHSLQSRAGNRHAVFFTHPRESIAWQYERNAHDPRVTHQMTLDVDNFGNVLKSAAIGYGRRQPKLDLTIEDQNSQGENLITYSENHVTNDVQLGDDYHAPVTFETQTYQLSGLNLSPGNTRFTLEEIHETGSSAAVIDYEKLPSPGRIEKRLIEHQRILFRRNNLAGPLPLGELQSQALPFERYELAFTPGLVAEVYGGRVSDAMLEDEGRYVHTESDANWWVPSGRTFYSPNRTDTSAQERDFARHHFFLPHRYRNPFHTDAVHTESIITYDDHNLLMLETRDALGNRMTVGERDTAGNITVSGNDYRVLQPRLVSDPNRNRTQVAYDALGMIAGTAVMGKPVPGIVEGDSLDGFEPDLTESEILDHLANPMNAPHDILGRASTRQVHDLFGYHRTRDDPEPQPGVTYALARETHAADLPAGERSKLQLSFSYSDGFGREIQQKIQAEPGPVTTGGPDISPRWTGTGWTIYNNKELPVRQYEPFFSDTHRFEFGHTIGVSAILFYDPIGRVVTTLHPNRTYEKVLFDSWHQETYDVSDTVAPRNEQTGDPRTDPDTQGFVAGYFRTQPAAWQTWSAERESGALGAVERTAAQKSAHHADTPSITHLDTLGRPFLSTVQNRVVAPGHVLDGTEPSFVTRIHLDIEGNERSVADTLDRVVMRYDYDMLGNRIHQASMEAGERWVLNDVEGNPIRAWDSRSFEHQSTYDELRRPAARLVVEDGSLRLVERIVYGESSPNPELTNLRGQVVQRFDQAGVVTSDEYDFKGNLLRSERRFAREYRTSLDWSSAVPLAARRYLIETEYDALNRPTAMTSPDGSVYRPTFNEANLLDKVDVNLRGELENGQPKWTSIASNIDYNARGQRERIEYGNGARTTYEYDNDTFRLKRMRTTRTPGPNGLVSDIFTDSTVVQDLRYTYDPAGNMTHSADAALRTIHHDGQQVEPENNYTYDAVYRLIEARGREHIGQTAFDVPNNGSRRDYPFAGFSDFVAHPNDTQTLRNYTEQYEYDDAGNLRSLSHRINGGGWTRHYDYLEDSLIEVGKKSNRLTRTRVGNGAGHLESYSYTDDHGNDVHGCMTAINGMKMIWNIDDQLQQVDLGGGGKAFYVYDAEGQRARKVIEKQNGTPHKERLYFGDFEVYREFGGDGITVEAERETLHIMDDQHRIALLETPTIDAGGAVLSPTPRQRYQLGNYLDSASVELADDGGLISYEEYHPYGTSAFQAGRNAAETSLKRYRFTGKERDEETGFNYHGARYYAPWLGRWVSCDPIGIRSGLNLFAFASDNPGNRVDPDGHQDIPAQYYPDPFFQLARGFGALFEFFVGGRADPIREERPSLPEGGLGGVAGGTLHTLTFRVTGILEDYPSLISEAGMESGASMIPVLDPAERLITGETVTGRQTSRTTAAIELVVQVAIFALARNSTRLEPRTSVPRGGRGPIPRENADAFGTHTGEASGRPFNADVESIGVPIRELKVARVRITTRGIDTVERHLSRFGPYNPNQRAIERLRRIVSGDIQPTTHDLNFYTHELREYVRYRRLGYEQGVPRDPDQAHRVWNDAHTATLEDYGLRDADIYHPSTQGSQ